MWLPLLLKLYWFCVCVCVQWACGVCVCVCVCVCLCVCVCVCTVCACLYMYAVCGVCFMCMHACMCVWPLFVCVLDLESVGNIHIYSNHFHFLKHYTVLTVFPQKSSNSSYVPFLSDLRADSVFADHSRLSFTSLIHTVTFSFISALG